MLLKYFRFRRAKTSWNRHRSLTCQCVNRSNNSMINRGEWDLSNNSCLYDVYIIWVDIVATVCWVQGGVGVWQLLVHVATTTISLVARFCLFYYCRCEKNAAPFCFWVCKLDTSSNFEFTPTFHNDHFYFFIVVTPRWGNVYLNEHHHCRWGATCTVYKK